MTIKSLINKGDYMINIDFTDAYLTVPIHPNSQQFLRFLWQGQSYQFVTMPFGLNVAPRVFTKLMKPVIAWLRGQGVRMIIFLNDILVLAPTIDTLNQHARMAINLLESLGFLINYKKSTLVPTQRILFLGMLTDSSTMEFVLPTDKIRRYSKRVSESFEDTTTFHQTNITGSRPPGIHSSSHLVCPLTLSPYPAVTDRVSTSGVRLRHASESLQRGEIRLDVVDTKSTTTERKSYSSPHCRSNNLLRRFQNRMGSVLGEDSNGGPLEHPGVPRSHKHPGTQSGFLCSESVDEGPEQQGDLSQDRQFNRSSLSEQ